MIFSLVARFRYGDHVETKVLMLQWEDLDLENWTLRIYVLVHVTPRCVY